MQKQWFVLSEKFSKLTSREQYIILLSGVIIFFLLFNSLVFENNQTKTNRVKKSLTQLKSKNSTLTLELAKAQVQIAKNPNDELHQSIELYQQKLASMDKQLYSLTNELISPQEMRKALQNLLNLSKVKIVSFESLPAETLLAQSAKEPSENNSEQIDLYRHSIRITLEGDFFQLRDYLKSVENMPWSFYWHEFDYSVSEYPNAQLNIEMYSLSTKKEFIGV
ncbi:hypothetical protein [Thalassomonas sp. M1454]|uniref:hypothetical protein n=1 Tax=Thalassomonas sp. M1454 TaxID=2594477 RepID=UPI00117E6DD7|nr:hypothetical protein [Thalassomonas sp. M1454]TRX52813.1 hypothetical protein FNN08_15760 [Thalassomonas sp. M1454]